MIIRIFEFFTITVWGAYILNLAANGKLAFYIHPRYFLFTTTAGVILVATGVAGMLYYIYQNRIELGKRSNFKLLKDWKLILLILAISLLGFVPILGFSLLVAALIIPSQPSYLDKLLKSNNILGLIWILVIVVALTFPPKALSARSASQRAGTTNVVSAQPSTAVSQFVRGKDDYGIGEWIAEFKKNPDVSKYVGEEVSIEGFIFDPDSNSEQFVLSKFIVRCCVVDASPVGIPVIFDWKSEYSESDWVRAEGVFTVINKNGQQQIAIDATGLEPISQPDIPYIY